MTGRADLRATALRIRRDYRDLLATTAPRRVDVLDVARVEEARHRVVGRRRAPARQLSLDLTPPREET